MILYLGVFELCQIDQIYFLELELYWCFYYCLAVHVYDCFIFVDDIIFDLYIAFCRLNYEWQKKVTGNQNIGSTIENTKRTMVRTRQILNIPAFLAILRSLPNFVVKNIHPGPEMKSKVVST